MLVCDGVRRRGWPRQVEGGTRFAGQRDADSPSSGFARRPTRRVTVVSTDQRLRKAAKRAAASSLTSEAFLAQIATDMEAPKARASSPAAGKPEVPLDPFALRRWLDEFGLGSDELRRLAGQAATITPPVRDRRARARETDPAPDPAPKRARVPGGGKAASPPSGAGDLSDADLQRMLADALRCGGADLPPISTSPNGSPRSSTLRPPPRRRRDRLGRGDEQLRRRPVAVGVGAFVELPGAT